MARLLPGDPARGIAGVLASPEDVERIRQSMGLDKPLLVQYGTFLGSLLRLNLGVSAHTNAPGVGEIGGRLPYTIALAVVVLVLAVSGGLLAGGSRALRRHKLPAP